jgi:hypothetical protein
MRTVETGTCPSCGRENEPGTVVCGLCGELLRRKVRFAAARSPVPPPEDLRAPRPPRVTTVLRTAARPSEALLCLGMGVPVAFLLSEWSLDLLSYMGWFVTALVHEMGHTAVALLFGSAAWPAIRLDGHAAAFHKEPSLLAAAAVWVGVGVLWGQLRGRRGWRLALGTLFLLYPALVLTDAKEVLHLAAGHLGELTFATVFLWRAFAGGFTESRAERILYAALGLLWSCGCLLLFGSLVLSAESRRWYLTHGSFGMQNDFVRIARMLGTSLPTVSLPMILVSIVPLPLAWHLARRR